MQCARDYGATSAEQRASSPLATATVQHVGSSAIAGAQQDVSSLTAGAQRAVSPATAGAQRAVAGAQLQAVSIIIITADNPATNNYLQWTSHQEINISSPDIFTGPSTVFEVCTNFENFGIIFPTEKCPLLYRCREARIDRSSHSVSEDRPEIDSFRTKT